MTAPSQTSGIGTSLVRTFVPIVVGSVIARFFPGVDQHDPNVLLLVSGVISYIYYTVVRVTETYFPKVGFLLGIAKAPAYVPGPSPAPGPDQVAVAIAVADPDDPEVKPAGEDPDEFPDGDLAEDVEDDGAPVVATDEGDGTNVTVGS